MSAPGLFEPRGGMGGHQSAAPQSDVWLTPPHILAALGPFDLDPCSPGLRPWPTAATHYTLEDDGLKKPWHGRVFCNPPYGGPSIIGPWMRRMVAHNHGIALIFARTETAMFQECVFGNANGILFLAGRLHFHHEDGRRAAHNAGAPSCLVAYGAPDLARLAKCELPGRLITLH